MNIPRPHLLELSCGLAKFLCLMVLLLSLTGPVWGALPSGWTDADIGLPGLAGSAGYVNGNWTVAGGGADIYGTSDQFNFAYTNVTGDAALIAKVLNLQNTDTGSGYSKAGLMFRNDTTASSVNVSVVVTWNKGVQLQWRSATSGQTSFHNIPGIAAPVWLQLVRTNQTFTGYYSTDGSTWVQIATTNVTMNSSMLAGLDVTAHNNSQLNTANFTNVAVLPAANPTTNAVITNQSASPVLAASASLNGQVVTPGSSTPYVTIFYGPTDGGTNASSWAHSVSLGQATGGFSTTVAGLMTNTTYYFTAFASNSAGVSWAQPSLNFTTLAANPFATPVQVLTYHYDNTRQGANTNETLLAASNVNTNTFGKLFSYPLDGYVYTQPLLMTNVSIPGQGVHNIVFVATEHNTIYALDADGNLTGTNNGVLWKNTVGSPAISAGAPFGGRYHGGVFYEDINPEVGITGTPVIDAASSTLYVDTFTREIAGNATNFNHRIHALDVTTGLERPYSPVLVAGSVPGSGAASTNGVQTFSATQEGARAALGLANGILFVAYAGYGDTDPYHGWLFAYQATNLAVKGIFNTTPNAPLSWNSGHGAEGGIWMGGGGICVDTNINLYLETGNGSFTAQTNGVDFGDTLLKLSTTNTSSTNIFAVADYFTPFDQATLEVQDNDLGASGQLLLPDSLGTAAHPHLLVGVGKSGKVYLVDRDNLGHWHSGNDSQIVQSFSSGGGMWSPPVFWNKLLFLQPSSGAMKSFSVSNAYINPTVVATAPVSFSASQGGPVISANGTNNGIVWVLNNNNGNPGSPGALYALNATNISQMLWSSQQVAARDSTGPGVKMTTPMVAGGKVYVGGQYVLSVYGVGSFLSAPIIAPNGGVFTNSVLVSITNTAPGASVYYTLDGTPPTTNATLYSGPFVLTATLPVRAVALQASAVPSAVVSAGFVNSSAAGMGIGLNGAYYSNHTAAIPFTGSPALVRTDAVVNFNWGNGSPAPSISSNSFTVRWTGSVQPQFTETYTFYATTDDGVRLWINGQLIDDYWMDQTATTSSGSIALKAQQLYNITMEYYENVSTASAQLAWASASTPQGVVPQTQLYPFTNPPPAVVLTGPPTNSTYTAAASVTISADADALYDTIDHVDFYANSIFVGSVSNVPYALTATGLGANSYTLTAVAIGSSGLMSTSAPVNITVNSASGQPYGLTNRQAAPAFFNMPTTSEGSLPPLLSQTGVFSNTPSMTPAAGLIAYAPNVILWSDGAAKTRYLAVPNTGGTITPSQQIAFAPTGSWTFPAGTVFVKTFQLNTDTSNTNVLHRLETRLLVRDANGAVYGVTYKWRPDNSDADLQSSSSSEDIAITNSSGVTTQTWYYPSPSDCLQCHTSVAKYVLGLSTRQLNGSQAYAATGVTDNQIRALNRLGLFNPAFDETNITNFEKLSALGDGGASFEARARSYLDANCAQCHQPGGTGITFDARYDTLLQNQHLTNYPASLSLGFDNARVIASKDVWRSMIWQRMNTTNNAIKMPSLARNLVDSNALNVLAGWINSLPGTPALAPPVLTPAGGTFYGSVNINILPPDPNAVVYYTLDGSEPTTNSLVYSNTVELTNTATFSANAFETGYINSVVAGGLFTVLPPIVFTTPGSLSNGVFRMQLSGVTNRDYVLEASSNLTQWIPVSTSTPTATPFNMTDPDAANYLRRFYRVFLQP